MSNSPSPTISYDKLVSLLPFTQRKQITTMAVKMEKAGYSQDQITKLKSLMATTMFDCKDKPSKADDSILSHLAESALTVSIEESPIYKRLDHLIDRLNLKTKTYGLAFIESTSFITQRDQLEEMVKDEDPRWYLVLKADEIPETFTGEWLIKESYSSEDHERYYSKLARELHSWLIGSVLTAVNMEIADPTDFRKMPKAVLDEVVSLQPYRVALENAIGIWTELPQATTYPMFTSRIAHVQKILRVVSKIVPEKARSDPYRFCYTVFVTFNMIQAYGSDFQDKFTDAFFEHVKKEQDFHFEDIKQIINDKNLDTRSAAPMNFNYGFHSVNAATTASSSSSTSTIVNSSYYKPTSTYSLNTPLKSIPWMNMISANLMSQGTNTIGAVTVPSSSSSPSSSNSTSVAGVFETSSMIPPASITDPTAIVLRCKKCLMLNHPVDQHYAINKETQLLQRQSQAYYEAHKSLRTSPQFMRSKANNAGTQAKKAKPAQQ
ncbi:unnamed protein product [Ambrosiozyma monospora]|uniref:Unnamed protein product n=1 Tax=Ambrosiozyma monospora TaxID=43982 RepID=A0A9W6YXF4_AMBMO|nr:unnamed protein product [Ambrosiozyma monospora]